MPAACYGLIVKCVRFLNNPGKVSRRCQVKIIMKSSSSQMLWVQMNRSLMYVVTFIVKETRFVSVYPMQNKNEVVENFKNFIL